MEIEKEPKDSVRKQNQDGANQIKNNEGQDNVSGNINEYLEKLVDETNPKNEENTKIYQILLIPQIL